MRSSGGEGECNIAASGFEDVGEALGVAVDGECCRRRFSIAISVTCFGLSPFFILSAVCLREKTTMVVFFPLRHGED
jgi:hypothetical protein